MEIEINEKKNNVLFNRTEVHFTIYHEHQKTPNRDIIRNELADALNTKKDNVIIDHIDSRYGIQKTTGYAKVYSSNKIAESIEKKYILKRNRLIDKKEDKKQEVKKEEPKKEQEVKEEPAESAPPEATDEKPEEKKEQK
jgi:small subunit ribosomal protein S24e